MKERPAIKPEQIRAGDLVFFGPDPLDPRRSTTSRWDVPARAVMRILGQQPDRPDARYYSHVMPDLAQQAADRGRSGSVAHTE